MLDEFRRAIEPTACTVFPINLLWLPIIYWLVVFLYTIARGPKEPSLATRFKVSIHQMFRNAVFRHPSQALASSVLIVICILEYICAFPIGHK